MRIGFIGLGNMGSELARHLVAAGHTLSAYARGERSRANAVRIGLSVVSSPAEVAQASELVFTMVTAGSDVELVALGRQGIAEGASAGMIMVDLSTISPTIARDVGRRLAERGIDMLDAPVSGGIPAAKAASLTMFVGGEPDVFGRVRPVLECVGKSIFHMGPLGTGQVTKLANQIAQLACLQGTAEALLFAREQGADPGKVREALLTGYGASRMLDVLGKKMVERDFAAGIVAALHHKDIGVALELAQQSGVPLPITAQVMQQLNALMGSGYGEQDTSSLLLVLEQMMGKPDKKG
ncbi:MAG: 2-hydroxy-3-oxopropionate reductase [Acidithiobacillales bacterium SM23_46]|nr:MAG: 2-hydroxy-3-oxopropionate reductase [Acidithiobacillales bacterium SM23_46]